MSEASYLPKVAWEVITQPKREGGLSILDPPYQIGGLLSGWVPWAILVGPFSPWRQLAEFALLDGWDWRTLHCIWIAVLHLGYLRKRLPRGIWAGILREWRRCCPQLLPPPMLTDWILTQPLFDNPGHPFPCFGGGAFGNPWMSRGIETVVDIWDVDRRDWKPFTHLAPLLAGLWHQTLHVHALHRAIPPEWVSPLRSGIALSQGEWLKRTLDHYAPSLLWRIESVADPLNVQVACWETSPLTGTTSQGPPLIQAQLETPLPSLTNLLHVCVLEYPDSVRPFSLATPLYNLPVDPRNWQRPPGPSNKDGVPLYRYSTRLGYQIPHPKVDVDWKVTKRWMSTG